MSVDYSIAAIPTTYRGRRYRSRLEARWAAFFDIIKWKHEYEPFDLNGWVPDFLLRGAWSADRTRNVLVEVKPITEYDPLVGNKMSNALFAGGGVPVALDLLLLGVSPIVTGNVVSLGWSIGCDVDEAQGRRALFKCFASPNGLAVDFTDGHLVGGVMTPLESWFSWNGKNENYRPDLLEGGPQVKEAIDLIMESWASASNRVQWHPTGVRT